MDNVKEDIESEGTDELDLDLRQRFLQECSGLRPTEETYSRSLSLCSLMFEESNTETERQTFERLSASLTRKLSEKDDERVKDALRKFVQSDAAKTNPGEAHAVVREIEKLLRPADRAENHRVTSADRKLLAEQCLRLATNPYLCSQGRFNTCEMATMEKLLWKREPSAVIRVISNAALAGTIGNYDGKSLKLSSEPFKKDVESKTHSPAKGDRLYASQIFQTALVEREWNGRDIGFGALKYEMRKPKNDKDSGERLVASDGRILWEKDDNTPINDPGVDFTRISRIYKSIATGPVDKAQPLVIAATDNRHYLPKGRLDNMEFVDLTGTKALHELLTKMQREKSFPVIAVIAVGSGDERDLHVVTLSGYDSKRKTVVFHDQNEKTSSAEVIALSSLQEKMKTEKLKPWQLPKPTVKLRRER